MSYKFTGNFAPRQKHLGGYCPNCGFRIVNGMGATDETNSETPIKKAGIGLLNILVIGVLAYITYRVLSSKKIETRGRRVKSLPLP